MADYALLVGINDYSDHAKLNNAVRDVTRLEPLFTSNADGSRRWQVTTLLGDREAPARVTEKVLSDEIGQMLTNAEQDMGHVLFWFSGHGDLFDGSRRLVLQGAKPGHPDVFHDLDNLIRRIHGRQRIRSATIIVDCCYASGVGDDYPSPIGRDRALLTASRDVIADGTGNTSPFAEHVIRCLTGESGDLVGEITITDLFDYVSKRCNRRANSRPQLKVNFGSEPVVLRRGPRLFDPAMLIRLFPDVEDHVPLTWEHEGPVYEDPAGTCGEEHCGGDGRPHHHGRPYPRVNDGSGKVDTSKATEKQLEFDEIRRLYRLGLIETWNKEAPYVVIQNGKTVWLSPLGKWYRDQCENGWL